MDLTLPSGSSSVELDYRHSSQFLWTVADVRSEPSPAKLDEPQLTLTHGDEEADHKLPQST